MILSIFLVSKIKQYKIKKLYWNSKVLRQLFIVKSKMYK